MIERIADGLVVVTGHSALFCGLWTRVKALPRGYRTCAWTNRAIVKGDMVYRPVTSGSVYRSQRMLAKEVERRITTR